MDIRKLCLERDFCPADRDLCTSMVMCGPFSAPHMQPLWPKSSRSIHHPTEMIYSELNESSSQAKLTVSTLMMLCFSHQNPYQRMTETESDPHWQQSFGVRADIMGTAEICR
ncbi:hypothetical protein AOLI_G00181370 [Acnodon oligacanthus]